jgi:protein gp37
MAKYTKIEWTDSSWNPWHGCKKVSPGCANCYMYRGKKRFGKNGNTISRSKTTFDDPLHWQSPRLIFACSWSDWFIEDADQWRSEAWNIIDRTPHHTYQILTKRPERIEQNLPANWKDGYPNVWLGVSIENQDYVYRKELLINIPAKIRFISAEPLLGPVDFGNLTDIHWIISGGESGPKARPMSPEWAISIKDQCLQAGISYFHKQNGGKTKVGNAWGGRILAGKTWDGIPYFGQ